MLQWKVRLFPSLAERSIERMVLENGRYALTASKSVPAFKAGNVGEENKWVTLYACMAQE